LTEGCHYHVVTPDVDLLLAERAIARQIVRFARAMDDRDWDTIREIVMEDATSDVGTGPLEGAEQLIEVMEMFLSACGATQHLIGSVLVDVDGVTATSRAYVRDVHLGSGEASDLTFSTIGDYHDTWERVGDDWRMRSRTKHNRGQIGTLAVFGIDSSF
jgi:hypothetical protein